MTRRVDGVVAYVSYLVIALPLTVWVAAELTRNGRIFLADVFDGKAELAQALNKMLVVGAIHFLNVYVFSSIRRRSRLRRAAGDPAALAVPASPPPGFPAAARARRGRGGRRPGSRHPRSGRSRLTERPARRRRFGLPGLRRCLDHHAAEPGLTHRAGPAADPDPVTCRRLRAQVVRPIVVVGLEPAGQRYVPAAYLPLVDTRGQDHAVLADAARVAVRVRRGPPAGRARVGVRRPGFLHDAQDRGPGCLFAWGEQTCPPEQVHPPQS